MTMSGWKPTISLIHPSIHPTRRIQAPEMRTIPVEFFVRWRMHTYISDSKKATCVFSVLAVQRLNSVRWSSHLWRLKDAMALFIQSHIGTSDTQRTVKNCPEFWVGLISQVHFHALNRNMKLCTRVDVLNSQVVPSLRWSQRQLSLYITRDKARVLQHINKRAFMSKRQANGSKGTITLSYFITDY